jgi:hypothetical protein
VLVDNAEGTKNEWPRSTVSAGLVEGAGIYSSGSARGLSRRPSEADYTASESQIRLATLASENRSQSFGFWDRL